VPATVYEGPSERAAGDAGKVLPPWTVAFVAAQEWDGMVPDSWDGTVRLLAEIDLSIATLAGDVRDDARQALFSALFPGAENTRLESRASLVIGDAVVPFLRLHVKRSKFVPMEVKTTDTSKKVFHRAVVELMLDARPTDNSISPGAALGAIAQALAGTTLPSVRLDPPRGLVDCSR
jgi:hypothetical protein